MSSGEDLKSFVKRLLTIAAEDILVAFQQKISEYEEKIDSQHRLLEKLRPDTTILHTGSLKSNAFSNHIEYKCCINTHVLSLCIMLTEYAPFE